MKLTITYTSNLSSELMKWVETYSKEVKTTKRNVIEAALKSYRENIKRKQIEEGFKRASKDPDFLAMAEEGMDDYLELIDSI